MSPSKRTDLTERFKRKSSSVAKTEKTNEETNESRHLDIQKRTDEQTNQQSEKQMNQQEKEPITEQSITHENEQRNDETNQTFNTDEIKRLNEQMDQILKHLKLENKEQTDEQKPDCVRRSFDLEKKMAKRLKLEAALSNKYMNDIIEEALELWFKEKGKVPEQLLILLGDEDE